jgi:hypothetical protein
MLPEFRNEGASVNQLAVSSIDASLQELECRLQMILAALEGAKAEMDAAVASEREACAKIAESAGRGGRPHDHDAQVMRCTGVLLADRIRARGKGAA